VESWRDSHGRWPATTVTTVSLSLLAGIGGSSRSRASVSRASAYAAPRPMLGRERANRGRQPDKKWLHSGDLKKGQRLRGTVIEILDSHARLDVGLDTMATLHSSRILPEGGMLQEELSIGQEVEVWVFGVRPLSYKVKQGTTWKIDARLEVTMLNPETQLSSDVTEFAQLPPNALLAATVTRIEPYGIVVKVKSPTGSVPVQGFVHVSEIREGYVEHPADEVDVGQDITVSIVRIDEKFGRLRLTMKLPEVEGY